MSWTWKITSGSLLNQNSITVGHGYAGHGEGLNNPAMTDTPDVGPLPTGKYKIGAEMHDAHVGIYALPLTPDPSNEMFGRSAFFIHGDNPGLNHTASDGCIILSQVIRRDIAGSADDDLVVED